jgi:hypothetical protein
MGVDSGGMIAGRGVRSTYTTFGLGGWTTLAIQKTPMCRTTTTITVENAR